MNIVIGNNINCTKASIFTEFHVSFGTISFPDEEWTDFVYPVIDWWCDELLNYSKSNLLTLSFMDGTFNLKGIIKDNTIDFSFYDDNTKIEISNQIVKLDEFVSQLLFCMNKCKDIYATYKYEENANHCNKKIQQLMKFSDQIK